MNLRTTMPCTPQAVPFAREFVASSLPSGVSSEVSYEVRLLTSEAVTNALRHSGCRGSGRIEVRILASDERVRVEVGDEGPGFDRPMNPPLEPSEVGGFGLVLLREVAQDWGVTAGPPTTVWFEVSL